MIACLITCLSCVWSSSWLARRVWCPCIGCPCIGCPCITQIACQGPEQAPAPWARRWCQDWCLCQKIENTPYVMFALFKKNFAGSSTSALTSTELKRFLCHEEEIPYVRIFTHFAELLQVATCISASSQSELWQVFLSGDRQQCPCSF